MQIEEPLILERFLNLKERKNRKQKYNLLLETEFL